ncbi:pyocin knob domain-containing protein [Geobacillus stearothermophilus]|uniref:pyocin knob domain-containing protein n=1 Tax=Geobacillus stearothermophilus TaxID=1422 RepID=UPI003D2228B6
MAEISKFFNSAPGDTRTYQASDFADYFGSVLSTGLLHTDNTPALEVKCDGNDLRTYVTPGKAIMQGYLYENTSNLYLEHALPEPTLDRIDRIVLRLDKRNQSRYIKLFVKQGTPSANPVPPDLQRDDFIYELSLAQIRVRANTSTLNPADLIDERLDENLCGLVHSLISIPTSQFQAQWDAFMASVQDEGFTPRTDFDAHLADTTKHVTQAEKNTWNSMQKHKVTADNGTAILISGQDLNNLVNTGFYNGENLINSPDGSASWFYVEVIRHTNSANYVIQKAFKLTGTQPTFYMRIRDGGTWSAWSENLFTSVSDGKAQLESTITAKGGTVTKAGAVPTFAELVSGVNSIPTGKKYSTGLLAPVSSGPYTVGGLTFTPSVVWVYATSGINYGNGVEYGLVLVHPNLYAFNGVKGIVYDPRNYGSGATFITSSDTNYSINSDGFTVNFLSNHLYKNFYYYAVE